MKVIKKDGTNEEFNDQKIINAVRKSAERAMTDIETDLPKILDFVKGKLFDKETIEVNELHNLVELALDKISPTVAKTYRDYRNYKKDFVHLMDEVYQESQKIRFIGDKDNANTDASLVATKRCLTFNELNKRLYRKFFLTKAELQACNDGYIYVHDQSARLDTFNCCLCDVGSVMRGGFEMGNIWYNEPNSLDTAFDVMGDIILSTASQQYGGFTVCEVDKILEPYAQKSYKKYIAEYMKIRELNCDYSIKASKYALQKVEREFEQGWQGIEMKLNTVGSSRGDYPFITMTFGLGTGAFAKMCNKVFLQVHSKGQGKKGFEKPVLFPKLVFLYDKNLHSKGCECYDVYKEAIKCSAKTMYPDWLSLTGEGYVSEMYKKYGKVVSPMGK